MQVAQWCTAAPECLHWDISEPEAALTVLATAPGIAAAAHGLRYASVSTLLDAAAGNLAVVHALSTFCLTPPGDSPTRKGFWDALLVGCVPVVFLNASRSNVWAFSEDEAASFALLVPPTAVKAPGALREHLQRALPDVPRMRAAAAQYAAAFQFSFGLLDEEDHVAVGPDATDMILWRMLEAQGSRSPLAAA